jgi:hypothetical protein
MHLKKIKATRTIYKTAPPPDTRFPRRHPDGYAVIDCNSRILGGENLPMQLYQVISDCLISYKDYKVFKRALTSAKPGQPGAAKVQIHHHHCDPTILIRVDPINQSYIIGAWEATAAILDFSSPGRKFY